MATRLRAETALAKELGRLAHENGGILIDHCGEELAWRPHYGGDWTPLRTQQEAAKPEPSEAMECERHKQARWLAGNIVNAGPIRPNQQKWDGLHHLASEFVRLTQLQPCTPRGLAKPEASEAMVERVAAAIHDARYGPAWPESVARTPFSEEDRSGREYCLRLAHAAIASLSPADDTLALLREAREVLADAVNVPLADPYILVELRTLCERAGYGNVMSSASALWRERLGDLAGGEFVCSPCRRTAEKLLARLDTALAKQEPTI